MKNMYFLRCQEEEQNGTIKRVHEVIKLNSNRNVMDYITPKTTLIMPMESKTEAIKRANFWNQCQLDNGTYLLSDNKIYDAYIVS